MKKVKITLIVALFAMIGNTVCANEQSPMYPRHRGLEEGYRGFVSAGYTIGMGTWGFDRLTLNTTHGYQLNEMFFIGVGAGINVYTHNGFDFSTLSAPIYADARVNLDLGGAVSPFADLKIGYALLDLDGIFLNPSIGIRYDINGTVGLNIGVGYELIRYSNQFLSININGLSIKAGIDF